MTRALLASLLAASLVPGCSFMFTSAPEPGKPCNYSEASPIADGVFAVSYGIGFIAGINEASQPYGGDDGIAIAVTTGILATVYTLSAVKGFDNIGKCRRHQQELYEASQRAPQPYTPTASRIDAWNMTKQAKAAARAGDCETVAALELVVRDIDRDFHRSVFIRDAAIGQCMATREIPIEPPSATPPAPPPAPTP